MISAVCPICHVCGKEITPDQKIAPCTTCGIIVHAKCRDYDCPLPIAKEQKQTAQHSSGLDGES